MKNLKDFICCASLLAGITCHVGQEVLGMLLIIFENTVALFDLTDRRNLAHYILATEMVISYRKDDSFYLTVSI